MCIAKYHQSLHVPSGSHLSACCNGSENVQDAEGDMFYIGTYRDCGDLFGDFIGIGRECWYH